MCGIDNSNNKHLYLDFRYIFYLANWGKQMKIYRLKHTIKCTEGNNRYLGNTYYVLIMLKPNNLPLP